MIEKYHPDKTPESDSSGARESFEQETNSWNVLQDGLSVSEVNANKSQRTYLRHCKPLGSLITLQTKIIQYYDSIINNDYRALFNRTMKARQCESDIYS